MFNDRRLLFIGALFIVALTLVNAVFAGVSASDHTPLQICFGRGAVAATLFASGDRFDIYAIDAQDKGELVMSFSQEYLRTIPVTGEAHLLGESDRHIPIEFYRNANRLYRMVAGPDAEGKFFECTFNAVCAHERTWIGETNRPTGEVVPVCDPAIMATVGQTVTPSTSLTNPPPPTATLTFTPTNTLSSGPTNAPTFTPTDTVTGTLTFTPTDTPTNTQAGPTNTPTDTPTNTPSFTPTNTPTNTPSFTPTNTPTNTPTETDLPGR